MLKIETKRRDNTNCCVYGCTSRKGKDRSIHFHYFPKDKSRQIKLINASGLEKLVDARLLWQTVLCMERPATHSARVCSLHFLKADYLSAGVCTNRPKLRRTAIPSCNLPTFHPEDSSTTGTKKKETFHKPETMQRTARFQPVKMDKSVQTNFQFNFARSYQQGKVHKVSPKDRVVEKLIKLKMFLLFKASRARVFRECWTKKKCYLHKVPRCVQKCNREFLYSTDLPEEMVKLLIEYLSKHMGIREFLKRIPLLRKNCIIYQ